MNHWWLTCSSRRFFLTWRLHWQWCKHGPCTFPGKPSTISFTLLFLGLNYLNYEVFMTHLVSINVFCCKLEDWSSFLRICGSSHPWWSWTLEKDKESWSCCSFSNLKWLSCLSFSRAAHHNQVPRPAPTYEVNNFETILERNCCRAHNPINRFCSEITLISS